MDSSRSGDYWMNIMEFYIFRTCANIAFDSLSLCVNFLIGNFMDK